MRAKTSGLTAGATGGGRGRRGATDRLERAETIDALVEARTEAAAPAPVLTVGEAGREAEIGPAARTGLWAEGTNRASPCRAGNPRRLCRRFPCRLSLMTRGWNRWRARSR